MGLRATVAAAVVDDGAVLLDLDSKYFYAVNASGWAIVQMLEAGASPPEVAAQCSARGADESQVRAFVEQLSGYDLLEPLNGAATPAPPTLPAVWATPTIERQPEPLQNVIVSAFDPSIPLAE